MAEDDRFIEVEEDVYPEVDIPGYSASEESVISLLQEDSVVLDDWGYDTKSLDSENMWGRSYDGSGVDEVTELISRMNKVHGVKDVYVEDRTRDEGLGPSEAVVRIMYGEPEVERPYIELPAYEREKVGLDIDGASSPSSIDVLSNSGELWVKVRLEEDEVLERELG